MAHCEEIACTGADTVCKSQGQRITRLRACKEELEAECKERVAEKMEWLGERGTLQAEVQRMTGLVTAMEEGCYVCQHPKRVDELTCQKNALQQVVREREEQITRLQSSLTLSREEGRREGMMRAAEITDSQCADCSAAIRSEAKGERK